MPIPAKKPSGFPARAALAADYRQVRERSVSICAPLAAEDHVVQSMPDVSPPKWHLAHTTWFFENFLLVPLLAGYRAHHPEYGFLFNSYYETVGRPYPRLQRGLLARPTVAEVHRYRDHVDRYMEELLDGASESAWRDVENRVTLGLHHEEQHQELLLTDIKHIFGTNPLRPVYRATRLAGAHSTRRLGTDWTAFRAGVYEIGDSGSEFVFDNERPRHRVHLDDFRIALRPVTNGEFLAFLDAGGYRDAALWLAQGWQTVNEQGWQAPLYWYQRSGRWWNMTLGGPRPLDEDEPVCHVSYFEADAYARWAGRRLPSEAEWEVAARAYPVAGNFHESGHLHPLPAGDDHPSSQFFGDVWEWTRSAYSAYPGYRPLPGQLGEYNGKFMCGQHVLRGGSCASPTGHLRPSYRNFFYPADRWQFSGIRLAE
jgi:ergothioneine biosynthesis protein EgtB